ncbi:carbohydrate ABC transporter permease [uncultured Devosia sp.]|uniref:carbohydrate ABC transporter permease n=1 Tax=uncultured Devosia sp. TaxID=211434 RepID=UPI0035CAA50B
MQMAKTHDWRWRDLTNAALFLAPVVVLIMVLRLVPALSAVADSVQSTGIGRNASTQFVGTEHFAKLFSSANFWSSVQQTLIFNLLVNPIQIIIALALAVLLSQGLPASGIWRTLVFLPSAVPLAGSSIVWGLALRPDGPINGLLALAAIPPQPFLTSPEQVVFSIILLASWIGCGTWMVFLIAGLKDIPPVYYEAAKIDGSDPVRTFFLITLPLLRRPLLFVLVADTVANFVLFAPVQILTAGGPQRKSNFLMYDIFHRSFDLSDPHMAAAELVVLLAIMIAIVALQFKLLGGQED